MKLVVGLGNPGPRYSESRHNIGFRVVEALARAQDIAVVEPRFQGRWAEGVLPRSRERLGFLLPTTFMNRSGEAVALALAAHPSLDPARDLMLVYDDLDLPLGRLRLRPRGGAGGHRGVASVIEALATRDLPRLRFGIGRPEAPGEEARNEVVDFVLDAFSEPEEQLLAERIPLAAEAAVALLRDGAVAAMDRFNANAPTGSDSSGSPGGSDSSDSSGRP